MGHQTFASAWRVCMQDAGHTSRIHMFNSHTNWRVLIFIICFVGGKSIAHWGKQYSNSGVILFSDALGWFFTLLHREQKRSSLALFIVSNIWNISCKDSNIPTINMQTFVFYLWPTLTFAFRLTHAKTWKSCQNQWFCSSGLYWSWIHQHRSIHIPCRVMSTQYSCILCWLNILVCYVHSRCLNRTSLTSLATLPNMKFDSVCVDGGTSIQSMKRGKHHVKCS